MAHYTKLNNDLDLTPTQREAIEEILTPTQRDAIKEIIFNNIMEILPTIIKELTPSIMEATQVLIKSQIQDNLKNVGSTLTSTTLTSTITASNKNNETKSHIYNQLKERKDLFWNYTRNKQLAQLFSECLSEEPAYIPRKFRENEKTTPANEKEKEIYDNLAMHKVRAEIDVLNVRVALSEEKINGVDENVISFITSNASTEEEVEELKTFWSQRVKQNEEAIHSKWDQRIQSTRAAHKKDKEQQSRPKEQETSNQKTTIYSKPNASTHNKNQHNPNQNSQEPSARPKPASTTPVSTNHSQNASKNWRRNQQPHPPRPYQLRSSTYPPSNWLQTTYPY